MRKKYCSPLLGCGVGSRRQLLVVGHSRSRERDDRCVSCGFPTPVPEPEVTPSPPEAFASTESAARKRQAASIFMFWLRYDVNTHTEVHKRLESHQRLKLGKYIAVFFLVVVRCLTPVWNREVLCPVPGSGRMHFKLVFFRAFET